MIHPPDMLHRKTRRPLPMSGPWAVRWPLREPQHSPGPWMGLPWRATCCDAQGENLLEPLLKRAGFTFYRGKTNLGLGRRHRIPRR